MGCVIGDGLTHVDLVPHTVVYDFVEPDDVRMATLFHDRNLFPNLCLHAPESVRKRGVFAGWEALLSEFLELVHPRIVAFDGLHGLRHVKRCEE